MNRAENEQVRQCEQALRRTFLPKGRVYADKETYIAVVAVPLKGAKWPGYCAVNFDDDDDDGGLRDDVVLTSVGTGPSSLWQEMRIKERLNKEEEEEEEKEEEEEEDDEGTK